MCPWREFILIATSQLISIMNLRDRETDGNREREREREKIQE
jgi:hypothetical protein